MVGNKGTGKEWVKRVSAALLAALLAMGTAACGQEKSIEGMGSAATLESEKETGTVGTGITETGTTEAPETETAKESEAVENPEGQAVTVAVKRTSFNPDGSVRGSQGSWTEWEYDAAGNMTKETEYNPDGSIYEETEYTTIYINK